MKNLLLVISMVLVSIDREAGLVLMKRINELAK